MKNVFTYEINQESQSNLLFKLEQDTFLKFRLQKSELYEFILKYISEILENKDSDKFIEISSIMFDYASLMRSMGFYKEAIDLYEYFQWKLEERSNCYSTNIKGFIDSLDNFEILYNVGFLFFEAGDFDIAMYHFAEADKKFAKRELLPEGSFLITLIDKPHMPFWNFSKNICINCSNFMSYYSHFEYQSFFGKRLEQYDMQELLRDFNKVSLMQFVITIDKFWSFFSLNHNVITALKITRCLSELSWLLESYLKPLTKSMLFESIQKILEKDNDLKKQFMSLHKEIVVNKKLDDNEALIYLMNLQSVETNVKNKKAICLKTVHILRNHTSHNLEEDFLIFEDNQYIKKIFLCVLWCFFILKDIIKQNDSNNGD